MHGFQFQNSVVAGRKQAINRKLGKAVARKPSSVLRSTTNRCGSAPASCPPSTLAGSEICLDQSLTRKWLVPCTTVDWVRTCSVAPILNNIRYLGQPCTAATTESLSLSECRLPLLDRALTKLNTEYSRHLMTHGICRTGTSTLLAKPYSLRQGVWRISASSTN